MQMTTKGPAAWDVYIQYRILFRQWWTRLLAIFGLNRRRLTFEHSLARNLRFRWVGGELPWRGRGGARFLGLGWGEEVRD